MSHLLELYAKDLGVQIEHRPLISRHFYPLKFKKYITIHTSNKVPTKNYSYWSEVVSILKPELSKRGFGVVQIGTEEDPKINGVDVFLNKTSMHQMFFIVENAACHLGIDSCPVHVASALDVPTVSLYAHTYANSCKPVWNKDKSRILESHRNGEKPSFSYHEDPKRIDLIKPEEIANEVFKTLKFKDYKTIKTVYIGEKFLHKKVDVIPSKMPEVNIPEDCEIRIRMDIAFNEQVLINFLGKITKKVTIKTDKPISEKIINLFKGKIEKVCYYTDHFSPDFLTFLKKSGLDFRLKLKNKKDLKNERIKYFNFEIEYDDSLEKAKKLRKKIKHEIDVDSLKAFSGKYYINGPNVHTFIGDPKKDIQFWVDLPYFMCYSEVQLKT